LFDTSIEERYNAALGKLGVDAAHLMGEGGNA